MPVALGLGVPPHTPHAIPVSLPTWRDNVGYEGGEQRVVDAMISGYPRFFNHLSIRRLATICEHKYAVGNEQCMLFPARAIAAQCRDFIRRRSQTDVQPRLHCRSAHRPLSLRHVQPRERVLATHRTRLAEKCLSLPPDESKFTSFSSHRTHPRPPLLRQKNSKIASTSPTLPNSTPTNLPTSLLSPDLEERYGRNLPLSSAESAKRALPRRIAGTLIRYESADCGDEPCAGQGSTKTGPSLRGVKSVTEDDVYLYPCGVAAIWSAHRSLREIRPEGKSVCFGFTYTDTLKIQKWGPGAHFYGSGLDSDIDSLTHLLESSSPPPGVPPILSLFTEFPSNPLLRSANLPKLRALADKYNFLIVVDETFGNFVNCYGASDVMGGSLVLNPNSKHYLLLKSHLSKTYIDTYFNADGIYLERNSRDFKHRISRIDKNTESICDFLYSHSVAGGYDPAKAAIKAVFYPKYITPENYALCKSTTTASPTLPNTGNFGGLFSLTFTTPSASSTFFDSLPCYKGPSLGTNFTLACPYTVLAHYGELEWAEEWGVERGLVRVSVGLDLCRPEEGGEKGGMGLWMGLLRL
ncbi:hypothetical protein NP233_g1889 [Leucocoprinus birnbaumii]|uniref:PLP-dependent transferase n=1 Tax=Leucocoprinus birnbaumii TaxID=56174 RepID=A0AAD5W021_9AGAR|nr:hypothetical protein NP233_g1889 [Leucocoprinus birnbaumii]